MPYCSQCGSFLAEDAKYCSECGRQVGVKPEPAQPLYMQKPQSLASSSDDLGEMIGRHPILFVIGCVVALVFVVGIVSAATRSHSKPNPHHLATPPVQGALTGNAWPVTGTNVWCAWSNHLPPTNQQDLSSLQGNSDHVEMHLTLHNSGGYKVTVQVVSAYYIGEQSHGDSQTDSHVHSVAPHSTISWYLNAGTPQGVKTDTPISMCRPTVQIAPQG